jgi:hypothetical protein
MYTGYERIASYDVIGKLQDVAANRAAGRRTVDSLRPARSFRPPQIRVGDAKKVIEAFYARLAAVPARA